MAENRIALRLEGCKITNDNGTEATRGAKYTPFRVEFPLAVLLFLLVRETQTVRAARISMISSIYSAKSLNSSIGTSGAPPTSQDLYIHEIGFKVEVRTTHIEF